MGILPFIIVTMKVPVRTAFGTVRFGTGSLIRLKRKEWINILVALVVSITTMALFGKVASV